MIVEVMFKVGGYFVYVVKVRRFGVLIFMRYMILRVEGMDRVERVVVV